MEHPPCVVGILSFLCGVRYVEPNIFSRPAGGGKIFSCLASALRLVCKYKTPCGNPQKTVHSGGKPRVNPGGFENGPKVNAPSRFQGTPWATAKYNGAHKGENGKFPAGSKTFLYGGIPPKVGTNLRNPRFSAQIPPTDKILLFTPLNRTHI